MAAFVSGAELGMKGAGSWSARMCWRSPSVRWCHVDAREHLQWVSPEVSVTCGANLQHPQQLLWAQEGF